MNHEDARDATQETFLYAYERLWQVRLPDRFGAWVARVALTRVGLHTRRRSREAVMDVADVFGEEPDPVIEQHLFERDDDARRLVERGLRALPEPLRAAVTLRFMSDATYEQVGESLAIPASAAERRVQRGLTKLREYFRRCGITDADGSSVAGALKLPVGAGVLADVMESVRGQPPPRSSPTSPASAGVLAVSGVGGGLVTALLACGLFLATWAEVRGGSTAAGDGAAAIVLVGHPAPSYGADATGVLARDLHRGPIPQNAVLILDENFDDLVPGQPLPGWTEGVYAQSDDVPPGGGRGAAVVNTNIPSAYCRFPLVKGIVTVELWLKPQRGDRTNCTLWMGNHLRGWTAPDGVHSTERPFRGESAGNAPILRKNDRDMWLYDDGLLREPSPEVAFAAYDGKWRHMRVRYDTARHIFDLYMDGQPIRRDIPSPWDLSAGVSYVSLSSGRWRRERDEPSLFDGVRVYVEPFEDDAT